MSRILILVAALCFATFVHAQIEFSEDLFPRLASLEKDVHFFGTEGDSTVVPAGTYLVTASDDEIQLFNLRTAENFDIHAVAGTHEEQVDQPTAMSVAGTEELPDSHEIVLMYADGTEVSAIGSYSGIQPRGLLGNAKKKADAARRAAQQRAMQVKREAQRRVSAARQRAKQLAAEARRRIEEGAAVARRKAHDQANGLLAEMALAASQNKPGEVAKLTALNAPRLVILASASMSAQKKAQYVTEARRQLQIHRPFIDEVVQRIASNRNKFVNTGEPLSKERLTEIARVIWGEGDNELRHPFAAADATTRGVSDAEITTRGISGIAFTIGVSYDVGLVVGFGAGTAATWMIPPFSLFSQNCTYGDAHASIGLDVSGGGNIDVGFWGRRPDNLGGPDVSVEIGIAALLDLSVSLSFEQGDDGGIEFAGFSLSPGAGAGIDISLATGYAHLVGCVNHAMT